MRLIASLHYAKMLEARKSRASNPVPFSAILEHVLQFEKDGFDAVFYADFLGINRTKLAATPVLPHEPLTFMGALAASTSRIGLVATASTMFEQPYNIARQFASLDHLSGGRIGWNAVTSFNGEKNYGLETIPSPEERYDIAEEFIDVVEKLWSSWGEHAILNDGDQRRYVDTDQVRDIEHKGRHFAVKEALDIPRSPQERPVIFQAGASERGIQFAARYGEALFVATPSFDEAAEFYRQVKSRARDNGRTDNSVKIFPGVHLFLAETDEQAQVLFRSEVTEEDIRKIVAKVEYEFPEFRLSGLPLDEPIPTDRIPTLEAIAQSNRRRSRAQVLWGLATREGSTLRDFLDYLSHSYGHLVVVGTPESAARELAHWYQNGAADGFIVLDCNRYDLLAEGLLPLLRKLGLWHEPTAITLRENLGIEAA